MSDPFESIAGEALPDEVVTEAPSPSILARLLAPSDRSRAELDADEYAEIINGLLDKRMGGGPAECGVGQGTMDCAYALMGTGEAGQGSPLMRLGTALTRWFIRLRRA